MHYTYLHKTNKMLLGKFSAVLRRFFRQLITVIYCIAFSYGYLNVLKVTQKHKKLRPIILNQFLYLVTYFYFNLGVFLFHSKDLGLPFIIVTDYSSKHKTKNKQIKS